MTALRIAEILECENVDQAITKVATVAAATRAKQGFDLGQIGTTLGNAASSAGGFLSNAAQTAWSNPHARRALIGAGLGAGGNALMDLFRSRERKRGLLRSLLEGGVLGGGVGGGSSLLMSNVPALGMTRTASFEKKAIPEWLSNMGSSAKSLLGNEHVRHGLIGAGIGAAGGGLSSLLGKKKRKGLLSSMLTGGLLGGAVGGGGSLAYRNLINPTPSGSTGSSGSGGSSSGGRSPRIEAAEQAQSGYNELARLGFDETRAHDTARQLREGSITSDAAREQIQAGRPGFLDQAQGILPGTWHAARTGDVEGALRHADVLGLKAMNPMSGSFDPSTAGLAVGGNIVARSLQSGGVLRSGLGNLGDSIANRYGRGGAGNVPGLNELGRHLQGRQQSLIRGELDALKEKPSELAKQRLSLGRMTREEQLRWARGNRTTRSAPTSRFGRITGGTLPGLVGLAPLLAHEWGGSGYRSGAQPAMDIVEANRILSGS